jgi:putative ABC transport system ATP-binding protein
MNTANEAIIRTHNLQRHYKMGGETIHALSGVDLAIGRGEYVAIMGPSGSGKSTLMNMIGCLDSPDGGEYWLNGTLVSSMNDRQLARVRNKEVGFVFQTFNLLPALSAQENVEIALNLAGLSGQAAHERADGLLDLLELTHRARQRPPDMSGGEQQRLAVARALANRPDIILADEPTASLDSHAGHQVMELMRSAVVAGEAKGLVVVTHDTRILDLAHRVLLMEDGRLRVSGS